MKGETMNLYIEARVEKQLERMRRSDRKGQLAADEALLLMRMLRDGEAETATAMPTKYGELRLENCVKYDLGAGRRLVTLKHGSGLFVIYAGNHDNCDRWLQRNRGYTPDPEKGRFADPDTLLPEPDMAKDRAAFSPVESEEEEADCLEDEINDELLRQVFCGLVAGR